MANRKKPKNPLIDGKLAEKILDYWEEDPMRKAEDVAKQFGMKHMQFIGACANNDQMKIVREQITRLRLELVREDFELIALKVIPTDRTDSVRVKVMERMLSAHDNSYKTTRSEIGGFNNRPIPVMTADEYFKQYQTDKSKG